MNRVLKVRKSFIHIWFFGFMVFALFESCSPPIKHLPAFDQVATDPYGSLIRISYRGNNKIKFNAKGELLSFEKDTLTILTENIPKSNKLKDEYYKIIKIPKRNIIRYTIIFAESNPNGSFMISSTLAITHGFFLILSLPINFIFGPIILEEERLLYSFTSKKVSLDEIHLFCRFPLGIPEQLDIHDLKMRPHKNQKKR